MPAVPAETLALQEKTKRYIRLQKTQPEYRRFFMFLAEITVLYMRLVVIAILCLDGWV